MILERIELSAKRSVPFSEVFAIGLVGVPERVAVVALVGSVE